MSFGKRSQHENRFDSWTETDSHGRIYRKEIIARNGSGWKAVYLQEVDQEENTLRFWQEIYNEKDILVEIHEKYPEDKGHISIIPRSEDDN